MSRRPARPAAATAPVGEPGPVALAAAVTGLGHAREQLGEVVTMLERGSPCEDVIAALSAVTRAVDRAGFAVISTGMRECLAQPGRGTVDAAGMAKLFLSLA